MSTMPPTLLPAGVAFYSLSIGMIASGLSQIHGLWKWYRYGQIYTNKENAFGLGFGYAMESFVLPNSTLLKLPAVPFYLGSHLLDLFAQEDELKKACIELKRAVLCVVPVNPKTEWVKNSPLTRYISRHRLTWLIYNSNCVLIRIQRISLCSLKVLLESFKLVMRTMDVIDLCTLDPSKIEAIAKQSIREGGYHIPRCLNALVKNKMIFIDRLNDPNSVLGYGVNAVGANPEKMREAACSLFDYLEKGLIIYKSTGDQVGNCLSSMTKKTIFEFLSWFTTEEKLREYFDPYAEESSVLKLKPEDTLVPIKSITVLPKADKTVNLSVQKNLADPYCIWQTEESLKPKKKIEPMKKMPQTPISQTRVKPITVIYTV